MDLNPDLTRVAFDYLAEKLATTGIGALVIDTVHFFIELVPLSMSFRGATSPQTTTAERRLYGQVNSFALPLAVPHDSTRRVRSVSVLPVFQEQSAHDPCPGLAAPHRLSAYSRIWKA
jgi:hypothetical protein